MAVLVQRHNLNGIIVFAYINLHCLLRWHYALFFYPILYKHIVKAVATATIATTIRTLYFRSNISHINTSTSLFVHVLHSTLCCSSLYVLPLLCCSFFTPFYCITVCTDVIAQAIVESKEFQLTYCCSKRSWLDVSVFVCATCHFTIKMNAKICEKL